MSRKLAILTLLTSMFAVTGCATTGPIEQDRFATDTKAQLFRGLGPHKRKITTNSELAQRYFNDGLNWMYAFNHDEAIRSFTRATELDPDCAMAWWGIAYCQGPNYNDWIMTDARSAAAWDALQKAQENIDNTTPAERALIEALSKRYAKPWPKDRSGLEKSYADAMAVVWKKYPNDSDVGTLYAESMMVRRPWKLYSVDYTPAEDTPTIVAVLEKVMVMDPANPGANHLYIHAVEPSRDPDRGLNAASRLCDQGSASGHLYHMPSHIYVKTGRWNKAIIQNEKALKADAVYREIAPEVLVQHLYMTHNAHMLAYAAMMSGREAEAMEAARAMWANVPEDALEKVGPIFDRWMCSVYDAQKRFGRWDAILAEPPPPEYLPITTAVWRAHRAVAYAAKKDFKNAQREYEEFKKVEAKIPPDLMSDSDPARKVLEVSDYFVRGEIALQKGNLDQAAVLLEKSAAVEDTLSYGEPPQWLQPVRHTLGAVYLKSGRYGDAERVYREDLSKWRDNGWSLYGLSRALELQGKTDEAKDVAKEYRVVWARADEPITTSCMCIPNT